MYKMFRFVKDAQFKWAGILNQLVVFATCIHCESLGKNMELV